MVSICSAWVASVPANYNSILYLHHHDKNQAEKKKKKEEEKE
jgi:hypothetical protein